MIRQLTGALALMAAAIAAAIAQQPAFEIGYIIDFDRPAKDYELWRQTQVLEIGAFTPIYDGDVIKLKNPPGKVIVRLLDQPDPVTYPLTADGQTLTAKLPTKTVMTRLVAWAKDTVNVFDHEERVPVVASIRSPDSSELSAPILVQPQTLLAGARPLAIGWMSPKVVQIRILTRSGSVVASGKGVGSIWISPMIDLKPGTYRLELSTTGGALTQELRVVSPASALARPPELDDPALPAELRNAAAAAWYASQGKDYLLQAFQSVAPDVQTSRAARLLALAIIKGRSPAPPQ